MNRFCLWVFVIAMVLTSCRSNNEAVRVSGSRPKYGDRKIELEKLYVIDVTRINMFSKETSRGFDNAMDFDRNDNLYILDTYESAISVFEKNGQFVRSFGGPGQGPEEFSRPSMLFIKNDEIYIAGVWILFFELAMQKPHDRVGRFYSSQKKLTGPLRPS